MGANAETSVVAANLMRQLQAWTPQDQPQESLRHDYLAFLDARGDRALSREADRSHFTASCFVFTHDLTAVLLCFHKKGQFWVQLGGHIDVDDASVSAAAFREAVEEAGVAVTPASTRPLDVDRHRLGAGFRHCDVHWDVGFAAFADDTSAAVASDESEAVRWWPVAALPSAVPEGFPSRVARIVTAVTALV